MPHKFTVPDPPMLRDKDINTITSRQWERYVRARDNGHKDYIRRANLQNQFYMGNQWDAADLAILKDNRPALTINLILAVINTISGEQSSRRADIRFKPRRGGEQAIADTLTKVFSQITDANKLEVLERTVCDDGLIMDGRGFFDVRMDFSDNIHGEVRVTAEDPYDIIIDPDAKEYDPKTWNEVFKTRWMSLEEIQELYGASKVTDIRTSVDFADTFDLDSVEFTEDTFGRPRQSRTEYDVADPYERRTLRNIRVIERQYKVLTMAPFFIDLQTGDEREISEDWDDEKIESFSEQNNLGVIKKPKRRVRWTVTCDRVVLHDEWSPYKEFTIVPYFVYFRRGNPFGPIRNLISPQEQLNKTSSQILHIVNTTANSGWIIRTGSLTNMTPDELADHGSATGLVIEVQPNTEGPEKITPNQIPTGLENIAGQARVNIKEISGVPDSLLGTDSPEVSGVAIEQKQARALLSLQAPMENLRRTRQLVAERILDLVQTFYTEERVIMVTGEDDPMEPQEPMTINQVDAAGQVINDITLGEYDVIVSTTPARDSFDELQFAEVLSLLQAGIPIPPDTVIKYSHLADKDKIAKRMRMETGVEKTPEQQQAEAMQQALLMEQLQLELQELEAKVMKLGSETQLNQAKAQDLMQITPQLKGRGLEQDLLVKIEEIKMRLKLAGLSSETTKETAGLSAMTQLRTKQLEVLQKDKAATLQAKVAMQTNQDKGST